MSRLSNLEKFQAANVMGNMSAEEVRLRNLLMAFGLDPSIQPSEAEAVQRYRLDYVERLKKLRRERDELLKEPNYSSDNSEVSEAQARRRRISHLNTHILEVEVEYRRMFLGWEEAMVRASEWLGRESRRLV